jgi:hypothetical protein
MVGMAVIQFIWACCKGWMSGVCQQVRHITVPCEAFQAKVHGGVCWHIFVRSLAQLAWLWPLCCGDVSECCCCKLSLCSMGYWWETWRRPSKGAWLVFVVEETLLQDSWINDVVQRCGFILITHSELTCHMQRLTGAYARKGLLVASTRGQAVTCAEQALVPLPACHCLAGLSLSSQSLHTHVNEFPRINPLRNMERRAWKP